MLTGEVKIDRNRNRDLTSLVRVVCRPNLLFLAITRFLSRKMPVLVVRERIRGLSDGEMSPQNNKDCH